MQRGWEGTQISSNTFVNGPMISAPLLSEWLSKLRLASWDSNARWHDFNIDFLRGHS